jgi:hypothetical protein
MSRYVVMENNRIHEEYDEIPNIENFVSKFSVKDFRFHNIPMYYRRWKEFIQFSKTNSSNKKNNPNWLRG